MIETTVNIGLVKEDEDEFYNVKTVNDNLDKIDEEFGKKVNKAEGKDLSSNDYTNKEKEKLKNIAENANNYTHPTDAGNKHIPSGGSAGQVLKYGGSSGSASWGPGSFYGTCDTAASTAAKTVDLTGFSLFTGATVAVMFSNGNTAKNPTLNVNNTGAKAIYYRNAALTESTASIIAENGVYLFAYSGSYWQLVGDIGSIAFSEVADRLKTPQTIDGIAFDGSESITHCGFCETSGETAEKKVSITGFKLMKYARVLVYFNYENTAVNPKLNVNDTGAKSIYGIAGPGNPGNAAYSAAEIQIGYGMYEFVYDGSNWISVSYAMHDPILKFTSLDTTDSEAESWTSVEPLAIKKNYHLSIGEILHRISAMFKNIRYLYNLLGTTDIFEIGDGTVTGILNSLKSNAGTLIPSYAESVKYVYNLTTCTVRIDNVLDTAPVHSNFTIAILPEKARPKIRSTYDLETPGGGKIRINFQQNGEIIAYRYNDSSVYNIGATFTYVV